MIRTPLLALLALSCVPPEVKVPDDSNIQETDSDTDTDPFEDDGVSPYLVEGTVTCISLASGDLSWSVNATLDDAQGTQTLLPLQDIAVDELSTGTEIYRQPKLACNHEGTCVGSLHEDLVAFRCVDHARYQFRVVLTDADGNQYADGFKLTWVEPEAPS